MNIDFYQSRQNSIKVKTKTGLYAIIFFFDFAENDWIFSKVAG